MLEPGSTVTIWPRRGMGLAAIDHGTVVREDDLGVVVHYCHEGRRQRTALHWSVISRIELLDDMGAISA